MNLEECENVANQTYPVICSVLDYVFSSNTWFGCRKKVDEVEIIWHFT